MCAIAENVMTDNAVPKQQKGMIIVIADKDNVNCLQTHIFDVAGMTETDLVILINKSCQLLFSNSATTCKY